MSRKRERYVLMRPCWVLLVDEIIGRAAEAIALGPNFSSHVRSII